MTNKLTHQTATTWELEIFPDFPPRDDMQNVIHLHIGGHLTMLIRHFGNRDNTLVLAEMPVYWRPSRNARIPDLLVAFNINPAAAIDRNGYAIEEHGKPPDFVLEVASDKYCPKRLHREAGGLRRFRHLRILAFRPHRRTALRCAPGRRPAG